MAKLEELTACTVVKGILPEARVTVVSASWHGEVLQLVYRDSGGTAWPTIRPARFHGVEGFVALALVVDVLAVVADDRNRRDGLVQAAKDGPLELLPLAQDEREEVRSRVEVLDLVVPGEAIALAVWVEPVEQRVVLTVRAGSRGGDP